MLLLLRRVVFFVKGAVWCNVLYFGKEALMKRVAFLVLLSLLFRLGSPIV